MYVSASRVAIGTNSSDKLGKKIQLKVAASTIRTVEKKGGLDEYLINTSNTKLASTGLKLKKLILSKNN